MREIVLLILMALFGLIPLEAQEKTFAEEAEQIAANIDSITTAERNALVLEIAEVNQQLEKGVISAQEAKKEKERLAEFYANRIETKVNAEKDKLDELIAIRVDERVYKSNKTKTEKDSIVIKLKLNDDEWGEKRTTSQFVFAVGVNSLMGNDEHFEDNLKLWSSRFWEFGLTRNTRITKESNLLHFKYGLSLLYNNLKPENNMVFTNDDNQTILEPTEIDFKRNRFRNFYLNLPLHFELDFSPTEIGEDGSKLFRSHQSFRVGLGGYVGVLINSKNFFKYEEDGHKVKYSIKDNYNVNDFNYGLSGYVGYRQFTFYTKYDLQPLFKHNAADVHNLSLGLRWDFN